MVNERLRRSMLRAGYETASLADAAGVSAKSVERWLAGQVVPYPRTRFRVAVLVGEDETYLWPGGDRAALAAAELVSAWPRRNDVPAGLWTDLLREAGHQVDVLAFAGLFLTEDHGQWLPLLRERAAAGARVRLLLGDPRGAQLAARDREARIGGGVGGRVAAALGHYKPLLDIAELRLHDTPLYNSIYRFDDEMLVNVHAYGLLAAYTPVFHLRRVDGQWFEAYIESFERVWATARLCGDDEVA